MARFYNPIIDILAITLVIYISVDIFYRVCVAGLGRNHNSDIAVLGSPDAKSTARAPIDDYKAIIDRGIFGSIDRIPQETEKKEVETLEPTELKISLLGTVTGDKDSTVAVIEETGKRTQRLYRVGDSIQNAVVRSIARGRVVLSVNGRDEVLMMPEHSSPSSPEPLLSKTQARPETVSAPPALERSITVRQEDFEKSFENVNDFMLAAQAQMRPHIKDGRLGGVILIGIKAGSVFRRMGLRNGDIILAISGNSVSSPGEILNLYNDLKSGSDVSLLIERRGQQRSLNYKIR
ncbi:MAG: PDZ domain-containing protein [Deltaproteobacteria bacterium]|nr:PDZ domain-containing protein [Deltaproteobacteria bacterium]